MFSLVPPAADWLVGAVGVVSRSRPLPGVVLWCGTGLPCFMVSLLMVCPALRPRPCPRTSHCDPRISPPLSQRRRPSGIAFISWLINTAFHLAVYASCRPLGRRCKTHFQCVATRLLTGFVPVWEALRRFRPCGSPQAFASWSVYLSLSFGSFWFLLFFFFRGFTRRHAFARRHAIESG